MGIQFQPGDRVAGDGWWGVVVRVGPKLVWVRRDGEFLPKPSVRPDIRPGLL